MLRVDEPQPDEPQAPLSAGAQRILRADHDRGLHLAAVPDCEPCASSAEQDVAADRLEAAAL
jgi:hypothetical protein